MVKPKLRDAADDSTVVAEAFAHHDASFGNLVTPEIWRMLATARFDHGHHAPQLAVDLHIALQDDVVGHEGDGVGAESQLRVIIVVFHRHHDGNAAAGQRPDQ